MHVTCSELAVLQPFLLPIRLLLGNPLCLLPNEKAQSLRKLSLIRSRSFRPLGLPIYVARVPVAPFASRLVRLRNKLTHSLPFIRPSACPSMSHRFPRAPFSVFATTPWISFRCPATLVRLKLVLCPHSLAPTLVVLPSMSLGPPFHSLGSRTPAVMLFQR